MRVRRGPGRRLADVLISVLIAGVLVAVATLARVALTPQLGAHSPFMLYVAAVLIAGLVHGPLCGAMVLLVGGVVGFRLFAVPDGLVRPGPVISLILFWVVSAPVLATANELRVQLGDAMARLSAALERRGKTA